ncbi:MAG: hypothetical protein H0T89_29510 [Deltaproteobacteria bacterium]|nr:hypothetical protein [Deltaproteobacteria bacterium]MDQ3301045.1 hypothetical protein [Myxococcota bacterium]
MNAFLAARRILFVSATVAALASPALAGKPRVVNPAPAPAAVAVAPAVAPAPVANTLPVVAKKPVVDEVSKLDLGIGYGLKQRRSALPTEETEQFEAKALTESQVGKIVRERSDELEYCWLRLPPSKRVVSAAILHLSIHGTGKVASVEVNGDMPAGVAKCITSAASRWTFPVADAATEVDHGIMLTTTSQR